MGTEKEHGGRQVGDREREGGFGMAPYLRKRWGQGKRVRESLGTGKENFIGVGVGIGIGIDKTTENRPRFRYRPRPRVKKLGIAGDREKYRIGDRERDGVIDRHLCDGEFARFER